MALLTVMAFAACGGDTKPRAESDAASGGVSGAGADSGAGDASGGDGAGGVDSGASCSGEVTAMLEFVHSNKKCSTDAECVHVAACFNWPREHCSGGFYMNGAYNKTTWKSLYSDVATCVKDCFVGCGEVPQTPYCWQNQCWSAYDEKSERDACLAELGGASPCALCVCGACYPACSSDSGCADIFACASAAGCIGSGGCDPKAASFPCSTVNATPSAFENFSKLNKCAIETGCSAVCGK